MASPSLESLSSLNAAFKRFGQISKKWTLASLSRAALYGSAFQQCSDAKEKLSMLLWTVSWLRWVGVACDLLLLALIYHRFKERRDKNKAYKAAAGTGSSASPTASRAANAAANAYGNPATHAAGKAGGQEAP